MRHPFLSALFSHRTFIILSFYWIVATIVNFTKAVHIDDTQYLEVAKLIVLDPLHPMSGFINWFDILEPVRTALIHPPLISYIYAFFISIFGENESVLHLVMSFFTFLCIFFFYKLACLISPKYALLTTGFFVLGPAFLPSQNLMMDIPLVSFFIIFFYLLFSAEASKNRFFYYFVACILIGIASLMKYSGVILVPFFLFFLFLKKDFRYILLIFIPFIFIFLWSLFNLFDYGGIHILEMQARNASRFYFFFEMTRPWILDLGAIVPFSFVFIPLFFRGYRWLVLVGSLLIGYIYTTTIGYFPSESVFNTFLRIFFFSNGCFILMLLISLVIQRILVIRKQGMRGEHIHFIILSLWFFTLSVYLLSYLSLMAVRHVFIVLPPLFLLFSRYFFPRIKTALLLFGFIVSTFLGLVLSISDWVIADIYRNYPPILSRLVPDDSNRYFSGHWGLQWYGKKIGFIQYDPVNAQFRMNDRLIAPKTYSQYISPVHQAQLQFEGSVLVPSSPFTFLRTFSDPMVSPRGYYATGDRYLPFGFFVTPLEEFQIYRVYK